MATKLTRIAPAALLDTMNRSNADVTVHLADLFTGARDYWTCDHDGTPVAIESGAPMGRDDKRRGSTVLIERDGTPVTYSRSTLVKANRAVSLIEANADHMKLDKQRAMIHSVVRALNAYSVADDALKDAIASGDIDRIDGVEALAARRATKALKDSAAASRKAKAQATMDAVETGKSLVASVAAKRDARESARDTSTVVDVTVPTLDTMTTDRLVALIKVWGKDGITRDDAIKIADALDSLPILADVNE